MAPSTSDWQNAHLKEAAVAYALAQGCRVPARYNAEALGDAAIVRVARELGLTGKDGEPGVADLVRWLRDPGLRGTCDGDVHGGMKEKSAAWMPGGSARDEGSSLEGEDAEAADPLYALLCADGDVLGEEEKEGLAAALECEGALRITMQQRRALAVALRGSGMGTRREIALGILRLVTGGGIDRVKGEGWRVQVTSLTLRKGWEMEVRESPRRIPGCRCWALGGSMTVVRDEKGGVQNVIFYARPQGRAKGSAWGSEGVRVQRVRVLRPAVVFEREFVAQQCMLLYSLVTNSGVQGKEWAALFGKTKQDVSHLLAKLAGEMGGKAGFGGVRWKANVRGRKRSDQLSVISDQGEGGGGGV